MNNSKILPSIIHRCPLDGAGAMPCCGRTPFEVPITDRTTQDGTLVTCGLVKHSKKPPIGIMPRKLWDEQRLMAIALATQRYRRAGIAIPQAWLDEEHELSHRRFAATTAGTMMPLREPDMMPVRKSPRTTKHLQRKTQKRPRD